MNFKKIDVTATYPFFTDHDEPNLWYNKISNHEIEIFSALGKHPITGKILKAISPHIVEKYVTNS